MTLYREITDEEYEAVISDTGDAQSKYQRMWVVPVEPCEHGNTGEHVVRDPKRTYHPSELCAEVGGETP